MIPSPAHLFRRRPPDIVRSERVCFTFDDRRIEAHTGETIAAALLRAGIVQLRSAPADGAPRGLFCCMGLCQECAVLVDGAVVEACREGVVEGMAVRSGDANGLPRHRRERSP